MKKSVIMLAVIAMVAMMFSSCKEQPKCKVSITSELIQVKRDYDPWGVIGARAFNDDNPIAGKYRAVFYDEDGDQVGETTEDGVFEVPQNGSVEFEYSTHRVRKGETYGEKSGTASFSIGSAIEKKFLVTLSTNPHVESYVD